jgi:uncharacterized DUF497 family protein
MLFEWNKNKANQNLLKHGVSFEEASTAFQDKISITIIDPLHSEDEDRYVLIGYSKNNRLLVVVHTDRNNRTRIISARQATKKERKKYEESK